MKIVEMVELVLENGESYEFNCKECSVKLEGVVDNVFNLDGELFTTKSATRTTIVIGSSQNKDGLFDDLIEQSNILQVSLSNELESETYNVQWCDDDIDENLYQKSVLTVSGNLKIRINQDNIL